MNTRAHRAGYKPTHFQARRLHSSYELKVLYDRYGIPLWGYQYLSLRLHSALKRQASPPRMQSPTVCLDQQRYVSLRLALQGITTIAHHWVSTACHEMKHKSSS